MMKSIRQTARRFGPEEYGNATIEFMVTLPLILAAFVFAFEFSRLFWTHHIATNNVRSAVRYLSRAPLTGDYITDAENIAKTGDPDDSTGAYEWMSAIESDDIDIDTTYLTFTTPDFRTNGQVLRMQMDVPFTFLTFDMLNSFSGDALGNTLTLNIIEEARYYGE